MKAPSLIWKMIYSVIFLSLLLLLPSPLIVIASDNNSEVHAQWEQATKKGTIDAYQLFLEKYPSSQFTRAAELKLSKLINRDKIAVPEFKALPVRSSPPISCTVVAVQPKSVYNIQKFIAVPKKGSQVDIFSTTSKKKIGTLILDTEGDLVLGRVKIVPQYPGDIINRARFFVPIAADGSFGFDSTGRYLNGYWLSSDNLKEADSDIPDTTASWIYKNRRDSFSDWWLLLDGNIIRYQGDVKLAGYSFIGDNVAPLTFLITAKGYVYLHGKGSVKFPDGKEIVFSK